MVTGSGAQNRDEEVFGHKPFAVIADRLARAGIATLRYDDRATGKSVGGKDPNVTTLDFAADAEAGIEWLRSQKRFKKIGLMGHSEGGTIAFMLAAQKKLDFIVSLAGTSVKGDSVLLAQTKAMGGPKVKNLTIAVAPDARDAEPMGEMVHRLRPTRRHRKNQMPRNGS
jgi:dienelactone hydrolase